ncbi:MAG: hypothetical protein INF64_05840 [Roseomonas sp.]|nr:hypothetical protein [Roseomonas sp.]
MQPITHAADWGLEGLAPSMFRRKKTVHYTLRFRAESGANSAALIDPWLLSHEGLPKAIQALFLRVSSQTIVLIELLRCTKRQNKG